VCRTSHRKLSPGDSAELIAKFRQSEFWTALSANSVGPNAINSMPWPTQMISELTSAKNVFGHQARDGVCEDGDLKLCVCHDLMERLFEHAKNPKFNSAGALLRLLAANIPSGMVYNFRHYAANVAQAVRELYAAHPTMLQPLEVLRERKRKAKLEGVKKEVPKLQKEEAPKCKEEARPEILKEEPSIKLEIPHLELPDTKRRAFYSASFTMTQSSYSKDCVKRVEAGIKIGGVDPRDLISAINAIFG
jgi:hypothetical protein